MQNTGTLSGVSKNPEPEMSSLKPPAVPRVNSMKDLSQITDLNQAFDVMEHLHISMDGVCNLEEAVSRIKENFSKSLAKEIYIKQDRDMQEAIRADRSNRQVLTKLYAQANDFVEKLPVPFKEDLGRMFPDFLNVMVATKEILEKSECTIVVAGETGAGKSSLINLLAGCQVLPTDMINGTKTICELRNSDTRRFVLHYWKTTGKQPYVFQFNDSDVGLFRLELAKHVTTIDRALKENPYEKIEIYWPLPILGDGVVIVDSPGVGDNKLSRQLELYMTRAFGFIYVINISNAGGIHRDRLGQLLRQAVERSDFGFDPSTALFVCNWWDQVKREEDQHVLSVMLERLSKVWPGVRRNQIVPISSVNAMRAVENGVILDEYGELIQAIRQVLPRTFNVKLTTYYRWLSGVLKRSLYSLKLSSNIGHKEMKEKEATYLSVRNQMEALERDAESRIDVMRVGFRREVESVMRKLVTHLKTEVCQKQMANWQSVECPFPEKTWKLTAKEAASKFSERLASVVDDWERQNSLVSNIKSTILKKFQKELDLFEDQIKKIEGVLFEGFDNSIITDFQSSMKVQMPVKNVWKKARKDKGRGGDSGFMSLGNAISGCKALDSKALKPLFKNYANRDPSAMKEATFAFLQQYKEEDFTSAIKKYFDRIAKRFDAASRLLPEFLKSDQKLMQRLQEEVKGEQEMLRNLYPNLVSSCVALQGQLDLFFVQRLMAFEFNMDELKYDAGKPIGRGSFADVYRGEVAGTEGKLTVALKIQREKLTFKNVTDALYEDRTLRDMKHENIIRYYGAAKEQQGNDLRWIMVLEYCTRTIKQKFVTDPEARVPGRIEIVALRMDAMRDVAEFALQICNALCFLHDRGIVHRDLKSDNILLTDKNVVKLIDVGLAKRAIDISGTLAGTPVYMAPEILLQKGQYDMKADIYSLSVILWEMWYGIDAADHIGSHLFGPLDYAIKSGLRPSITMAHKPPDDWIKLLQSGWDFEADKRPSCREVANFFERFLKHQ